MGKHKNMHDFDGAIIVTIDGPAGTGKSTVAEKVAKELGLDFLDTGAMYRAATAIVLDYGIDPHDPKAIVEKVAEADLHFDWRTTPPALLAWLQPIDHRLRDKDVTANVSQLASVRELRQHLVLKQRIIAYQHPRLVSEGRDQGSVVFPDALVKFYLDADPAVRAKRRAIQSKRLSRDTLPEEAAKIIAATQEEILTRDHLDQSRSDGPLVCPEGAVVVDTSDMTEREVIDHLVRVVRATIAQKRHDDDKGCHEQ
ncbi:MAG: (d)CMP kinase [Phycisphaeraceae bacterium]|nr:(d)CMP kinase [Phycisphaerales bacterium]MCB9861345.1 (d)CMP kinase [Phycisphaeraceae bacterium]